MKRKILITLGVLLALLVVFIVIFAAVFDLDETINARKAEMLPQLEQRLGRGIEIGEVRTTLLPVLGAEIRDVVIKGRTPDEPPLLRIARVRFAVGLWTAIKSLGKEVRLDALIIDGLTLELIREADGRLSYEDVLARLSEGPPPEEAPKPLDPEVRRIIQNAELRRVALENSRLRLIDKATGGAPAETFINDLLIEVDDVKLSQPFEVHVAASVFADRPNFDLRVALGPVPIGQENAAVPIDKVALQAEGIDLSRLTPYLGPGAPASIHSATFGANLTVDDPLGSRGGIAVKGELHVANLALGTPKPGQAFTLDVAPNLVIDPVEGVIDLTGFRLALDKMTLTADGRIEGLLAGRPTFKGVMLKTADFDFTRLFALLPDARAALPPGMELGGPFALDVKAEGDPDAQDIQLAVDLDGARLLVPEALDKPAGAALHANLDAHLTRDSVDLKDLALALGPLALNARGTVRNFAQPVFNVKGGTGDTPIDGLARLLPAVRAAVPADVQIGGKLAIDLLAKGDRTNLDAKVGVRLVGADLAAPGATVRGNGSIDLTAKGSPSRALAVNLATDLDGLEVRAGDAFIKPAGTPLVAQATATAAEGGAVDVPSFALRLGPLDAKGSFRRAANGSLDARVTLERFALGELARLLPAMADNAFAAARIGFRAAVAGNPAQPASIEARLEDFYFAQGRSTLTGNATVQNPDAPRIRFDFNAPNLDLDELLPQGGGEEAPADDGPVAIPDIVRRIDAEGAVRAARGRMNQIDFTTLVAALTMKNGILTLTSMDFDAYGGHFSAARTKVDLSREQPRFDLQMTLRDVDANQILTHQANLPNTVSGRLNTEMSIAGAGLAWEQISQSLSGDLGLGLQRGKFEKLDLEQATLGGLVSKVPLLKLDKRTSTQLKDLAGRFKVEKGRMTLVQPMKTETAQGPLELSGSIGLDKTLDLRGTLQLQPAVIARLSGNKLKLDRALPVGLKLGGTLLDPKVSGLETEALGAALLAAAGAAIGLDKLEAARAKAEAEARARLDAAKNEARRQADRAKAEAEKAKKAAEDRAKAEAQKAKDAAKKKAEEEAKKRLKGLF